MYLLANQEYYGATHILKLGKFSNQHTRKINNKSTNSSYLIFIQDIVIRYNFLNILPFSANAHHTIVSTDSRYLEKELYAFR